MTPSPLTQVKKKPSLASLGGRERPRPSAVRVDPENLVRTSLLADGAELPLVIEPARAGVDLLGWVRTSAAWLDERLRAHGGLLFRGFEVGSPERFQDFVAVFGQPPLEYKERSSPRSRVQGQVYTSTDYPPQYPIFLHNECSYAHTWPLEIFFYCHVEPEQGGATPIADVRRVYRALRPETRRRFLDKGVLYVRNFSPGAGLSWQTVFQTDDRAQVETHARQAGYELEWRAGDRLRTRRRGDAAYLHPRTGEPVWFNHATFFHPSTLVSEIRTGLLAQFAPDELPNATYYGDGTPIEDAVLDELRRVYREATVSFPWRRGDVLRLDNMLVAHAREPYAGRRQILTAMTGPQDAAALRTPTEPLQEVG